MPGRAAITLICLALVGLFSSHALGQVPDVGDTIPTVTIPSVKLPTVDEAEEQAKGPAGGASDKPGSDPVGEVKKKVDDAVKTIGGAANNATGGVAETTSGGGGGSGGAGGGGSGVGGATSGGSGSGHVSGSTSGRTGDTGSADRSAERSRAVPSRRNPGLRASTTRFKNRKQRGEPYGTTLRLWLSKPALLRFVIRQDAPVCRTVGSFRARGERGVNQVRFRGRYRGELLPAGTYSITATAIRGSKRLFLGRVRVVIVPLDQAVKTAKPQPSRCKAVEETVATAASAGGTLAASKSETATGRPTERVAGPTASGSVALESSPPTPRAETSFPGPLPTPFEDIPVWAQAIFLGVLTVAITLLVAAAVPARAIQPAAAATAVAEHRAELAAAGGVLLGIAVVSALML